jgi:hypothetical protein
MADNRTGYTWDNELREKIVKAVIASQKHGDYVAINKVIMEIQKPFIETIDRIREIIK